MTMRDLQSKINFDVTFKVVVFVALIAFNVFYTPKGPLAVQYLSIGRVSLVASMLVLMFGRGIFASNMGMLLMVVALFLLLL